MSGVQTSIEKLHQLVQLAEFRLKKRLTYVKDLPKYCGGLRERIKEQWPSWVAWQAVLHDVVRRALRAGARLASQLPHLEKNEIAHWAAAERELFERLGSATSDWISHVLTLADSATLLNQVHAGAHLASSAMFAGANSNNQVTHLSAGAFPWLPELQTREGVQAYVMLCNVRVQTDKAMLELRVRGHDVHALLESRLRRVGNLQAAADRLVPAEYSAGSQPVLAPNP